jgi:hypothetical protein
MMWRGRFEAVQRKRQHPSRTQRSHVPSVAEHSPPAHRSGSAAAPPPPSTAQQAPSRARRSRTKVAHKPAIAPISARKASMAASVRAPRPALATSRAGSAGAGTHTLRSPAGRRSPPTAAAPTTAASSLAPRVHHRSGVALSTLRVPTTQHTVPPPCSSQGSGGSRTHSSREAARSTSSAKQGHSAPPLLTNAPSASKQSASSRATLQHLTKTYGALKRQAAAQCSIISSQQHSQAGDRAVRALSIDD